MNIDQISLWLKSTKRSSLLPPVSKLVVFLVLLNCLAAGQVIAAGWDTHAALSLDYWKVNWNREIFSASSDGMWGPRLKLSYGPLATSVYYLTGDFDIKEMDATGKRKDLKLSLEYKIHKYFTAMVAYENYNYTIDKVGYSQKENAAGLVAGVGTYYELIENVFLLGSFTYRPSSDWKKEASSGSGESRIHHTYTTSVSGYDAELGLGYYIEPINVSVFAEYRQNILDPKSKENFTKNTFEGPLLRLIWNIF